MPKNFSIYFFLFYSYINLSYALLTMMRENLLHRNEIFLLEYDENVDNEPKILQTSQLLFQINRLLLFFIFVLMQ